MRRPAIFAPATPPRRAATVHPGGAVAAGGSWTVVHVITQLDLGGAQLATLHQCAHSTFGGGPRLLVAGPQGQLTAEARALPGVQLIAAPSLGRPLRPGADARALAELTKLLRRLRRAAGGRLLVHTHSSKAGILGRLAARAAGAGRIVHSIHGFGHQPSMPLPQRTALWAAERAVAELTDGFTADSLANLQQARQQRLWRGQVGAVVRCGVDVAAWQQPKAPPAAVRAALGIADGAPMVLQLACLKAQKDPAAVLRLARAVRGRLPDAVFVLAGDGPLRPRLEAYVRAHGLGDAVRLLGWRRDPVDLMHACDVALLASRWEGLPQVLPQAMAAARPIVATDVDGNREAVLHQEVGLLVPPRDDDALAVAVTELLCDPERRGRMGAAGQKRAAQFDNAVMLQQLDRFYAAVVRAPGRRGAP